MRTVYINGTDWTAAGATPGQGQIIRNFGLTVVNAPRPLPCAIHMIDGRQVNLEWTGEFLHGTFYAAGPIDQPISVWGRSPTFRERWDANDAWPVELITNEEIEQRIREHAARDMTAAEYADAVAGLGIGYLAEHYGYPWQREETNSQ